MTIPFTWISKSWNKHWNAAASPDTTQLVSNIITTSVFHLEASFKKGLLKRLRLSFKKKKRSLHLIILCYYSFLQPLLFRLKSLDEEGKYSKAMFHFMLQENKKTSEDSKRLPL